MSLSSEKLSDIGEALLVEQIIRSLPRCGDPGECPGDDAAGVYTESGSTLLFCIDTLVEGVHFRLDISSFFDVGWKAVAVNFSDIAAMGGYPSKAVLSVSAPGNTDVAAVGELVKGASECASRYQAAVVGGDTGEAPLLVVTVAALGSMPPKTRPVLRTGARPGDRVVVTGCLGAAQLGLEAALAGKNKEDAFVMAHRRPTPRIKEGTTAASRRAASMIDVSDGLVLDASRLAAASGVSIALDLSTLPLALNPSQKTSHGPRESSELYRLALRAALLGGDDYELLFTIPEQDLDRLFEAWSEELAPLSVIGTVDTGSGVRLQPVDLVPEDLETGGWQHFYGTFTARSPHSTGID